MRAALPLGLFVRCAATRDLSAIAALAAQRSGAAFENCLQSVEEQFGSDTERGHLTLIAEMDCGLLGFGRARHVGTPIDADSVPTGWYLLGVIVAPALRRRGIASELTRLRVEWIGRRADEAFYFANSLNLPSIDLHQKLGFVEVQRPFAFPGAQFSGGGVGVLFRAPLIACGLPHSAKPAGPPFSSTDP
ncbi:MAG: GNAT family N-acetyltransferase [Gemmatimonadaceae bacterium]|nr:GNAT family N-acetyltransferase [Gemmatimonadaceae bacterium]